MSEELTYEECRAWAEKYAGTPLAMLPLTTAAARDPSPMLVMHSLFLKVERLQALLGAPSARPRIYWGCTTLGGCERGFNGAEEDMPRDWRFCPSCGGELAEITSSAGASTRGDTDGD